MYVPNNLGLIFEDLTLFFLITPNKSVSWCRLSPGPFSELNQPRNYLSGETGKKTSPIFCEVGRVSSTFQKKKKNKKLTT